jgi:hypothetical protein
MLPLFSLSITHNQTQKQHHCLFTAILGGINQSIITDYLLFENHLQDSTGKLCTEALGSILTVMVTLILDGQSTKKQC